MKKPRFFDAFARPALHVLLALGFMAAFLWPMFAFTRPSQTVHFSYGAWLLCLTALFLISRSNGEDGSAINESMPPAGAANDPETR